MSDNYWAPSKVDDDPDSAYGQISSQFRGRRPNDGWIADALNWYSEKVGEPIAEGIGRLVDRGGEPESGGIYDQDDLGENAAEFIDSYRTGRGREEVESLYGPDEMRRMDSPELFQVLKDMFGLRSPMDGGPAILDAANRKWEEVTGQPGPFTSYQDLEASMREPGVADVIGL